MPMTPGVPVSAPEQDDPVFEAFRLSVQQLLRGFDDLHLRLLPLDVDVAQLMGQFGRPVFVLTEHQLQSGDSAVHPARRIDAGCDGVADVLCRHRLACKAHFFQRAQKPGLSVFCSWRRPALTMVRFSPVRGMTSATVPTAARSPQYSSISSGGQHPARRRA